MAFANRSADGTADVVVRITDIHLRFAIGSAVMAKQIQEMEIQKPIAATTVLTASSPFLYETSARPATALLPGNKLL